MARHPKAIRDLHLISYHFPPMAMVSLLHRISGVLLVISIPVWIYIFGVSLHDAQGFEKVRHGFSLAWAKWLILISVWSLIHHFIAGCRFLLLDFGVGKSLVLARGSAMAVLILSLGLTLVVGTLL